MHWPFESFPHPTCLILVTKENLKNICSLSKIGLISPLKKFGSSLRGSQVERCRKVSELSANPVKPSPMSSHFQFRNIVCEVILPGRMSKAQL